MSIPNYKLQDLKHGIQINVNTINTDIDNLHDSFLHQGHDLDDDDDDDDDELIRVVSRRNPMGLSSAAACSYGKVIGKTFSMRADLEDEKQCSSLGLEKAVRRVFSMRASSSASANEVYRRIDHQYDSVSVADEENTIMAVQTRKDESNKKGNKILEACRRFFGF